VRPHDVMPPSTLAAGRLAELATRLAGELQTGGAPPSRPPDAWQVPLLLAADTQAWLLGWPAGFVTPAHDHGASTVAVTVLEGALTEECLDPTIWTTCRRTTWRAGSTTVFPPGHVHVLGAAGDRPAVAVHAYTPRWERRSAGGAAGFPRGGGSPGGGRLAAGAGGGAAALRAGGRAGQVQQLADGALDAGDVGDRVAG
jgi:quercetin dioxygenase-like cupin family protein